MQNAKKLFWPLKGELTEPEKEPALPAGSTGAHLKPSPKHLPPAICPCPSELKPIPVPAVGVLHFPRSTSCSEVLPGFGSSAEQPLGSAVLEEGQRTRTLWTVRNPAAGTGTKSPLPAQPAGFLLPGAVSLGCGLTLDLPQGLSRGGLSLCSGFAWWGGVDGLGLTLR